MSDERRPPTASRAGLCPLCGADLDSNSSACRRCGATPGRVSQCVHCRTTAAIQPHGDLGWVCEVCGGARIVQALCEQDASVSAHLVSATRNYRLAHVLRMASWIGTVVGAGALLVLLLAKVAFSPHDWTLASLSTLPIFALLGSLVCYARVKVLKGRTTLELENALGGSLLKLVSAFPEGATAAQLANRLEISPTHAEHLLARLNVRDDVQSIVTDDGQLLFRARGGAQPPLSEALAQPVETQLRVSNESDEIPTSDVLAEESRSLKLDVKKNQ